ncbi:MAG: putative selenate ABC transporter substrate-binding protein [Thermoanaerobaculia bacterium]
MRHVSLLFSLFAMAIAACSGEDPATAPSSQEATLRFSAIPDQNSTELAEKFAPLARHLSEVLDVPVEYVPSRDYQATVEMFRNGDIDLAWFGGLTGVQARHLVDGARAIAQGDSDPNYYSYFIANRSTGLQPSETIPENLGSFRFTFGSESSTSGRLMPEYFIREATGQSPGEFFEHPVGYSGSHDKTAELVASGQFEVGVINYKVYDQRVKEGKTDPDLVRVIWRTPPYADYNWTTRPDLDAKLGEGFTARLQQALIAIDDPSLLAALPREKLISASNEEFDGIRDVARELGMLR